MSKTAQEIVGAFIAAVNAKDLDAALAYVADDVEYENVGMSVLQGKSAMSEFLGPFVSNAERVFFEVHKELASDVLVMNERTDRFFLPGGKEIAIRLMGIFEVAEGRIIVWRDYFDTASFAAQMAG